MIDATGQFSFQVGMGGACFTRVTPTPAKRRVLTVDPGLRVGWAVVSLPEKKIEAAGFAELYRDKLFASAYKLMDELITKFNCDEILFERYFLGGCAHNSSSIEMRGAIKAVAERGGLSWQEIHPSTARANLGAGRCNKDPEIRQIVCNLFGIPEKYRPNENKKKEIFFPADLFDAVVLAWSAE